MSISFHPTRRTFLSALVWSLAGASCSRPSTAATPMKAGSVSIDLFTNDARAQGTQRLPRLVLDDAAWRARLPADVYRISRAAGTERPYSSRLLKVHEPGVFRCACCRTALFDAATKFESHTGWPSFYQPLSSRNVVQRTDGTFGMQRTEILCARCDAHLGHVFNDGPKPTGLRYCMNGLALTFSSATSPSPRTPA